MELAFLLRGVGAEVVWITYQKPADTDEVVYSLENKMLDRGVQVRHIYEFMIVFFPGILYLKFRYSGEVSSLKPAVIECHQFMMLLFF